MTISFEGKRQGFQQPPPLAASPVSPTWRGQVDDDASQD
jgi:hypothetical protein